MVRSSSGLHSHSLRLAKQDSITSLQTKLRQQFRQSTPSCYPLLPPSAFAAAFCCCCWLPLLLLLPCAVAAASLCCLLLLATATAYCSCLLLLPSACIAALWCCLLLPGRLLLLLPLLLLDFSFYVLLLPLISCFLLLLSASALLYSTGLPAAWRLSMQNKMQILHRPLHLGCYLEAWSKLVGPLPLACLYLCTLDQML